MISTTTALTILGATAEVSSGQKHGTNPPKLGENPENYGHWPDVVAETSPDQSVPVDSGRARDTRASPQ